MAKYDTKFIPQNKAPKNNDYISVYNGTEFIGKVNVGKLKMPALGNKLYSFGALSDVHVNSTSAQEHFKQAVTYLNDVENVNFICVAGDLTNEGTDAQLKAYSDYVKEYSPNTPVYEVVGNHELQSRTSEAPFDFLVPYTGHNLYYTLEKGDDLFVFFGMSGWYSYTQSSIFSQTSLQWLYEVLEANRNKRCIVFEHCPRFDGSGKPYPPAPTGDLLVTGTGPVFQSLMEHYKNVIWFHGHTHISFEAQKDVSWANYDRMFGCQSVHIPSTMAVKTINSTGDGYNGDSSKGMGYVVDVYEKNIVLRGRDFVNEKFLPIATYYLDTKLQTIAPNTFTDSTGTIIT